MRVNQFLFIVSLTKDGCGFFFFFVTFTEKNKETKKVRQKKPEDGKFRRTKISINCLKKDVEKM